jgi:hypothetical protein
MFSNSRGEHNTPWLVPEPGVLRLGRKKHVSVEVLPDGRLHAYVYCLLCLDHDNDNYGTRCD